MIENNILSLVKYCSQSGIMKEKAFVSKETIYGKYVTKQSLKMPITEMNL